mmetsp:Transcript_5110/g.14883  ORF Transcript_5110/g.14883 Transcript_5110/m.14883 type:complete len:295 (-) Transcript_5110:1603-2487(-)
MHVRSEHECSSCRDVHLHYRLRSVRQRTVTCVQADADVQPGRVHAPAAVAVAVGDGPRWQDELHLHPRARLEVRASKGGEAPNWLAQLSHGLASVCLHHRRACARASVDYAAAHDHARVGRCVHNARRALDAERGVGEAVAEGELGRASTVKVARAPATALGAIVLPQGAARGLVVVVEGHLPCVAREGEGEAAAGLGRASENVREASAALRPRVAGPEHGGAAVCTPGQHQGPARDDDEHHARRLAGSGRLSAAPAVCVLGGPLGGRLAAEEGVEEVNLGLGELGCSEAVGFA